MRSKAAKLVRPWSSYSSADATASNFPCLKHFFPCEDGAGTYGLRDIVGGVVYSPNGWEVVDSTCIRPAHTSEVDYHNLPLSSGAWNIATGKKTLAILCGKFNGLFSFGIGDSITVQEISFSQNFDTLAVLKNPNGALLGAGLTVGNTLPTIVGGYYDPSGDGVGFITDTNGAYSAAAGVSMAGVSPGPTLPAIGSVGGKTNLQALYGVAVFQFESAFPSDISKAIEWMRAEWARGTKAIYPGWAGLT